MIKSINLLIKQECANLVNNECIGVLLNGKLFNDTYICHLIKDKKPCEYFKKCVLPLEPSLTEKYNEIDNTTSIIESRTCKCGDTIVKFKRYCDKCKRLQTKSYHKKYNRAR